MKYCNDYHQLRKLPSGLLTCEHDLINNFYADRYKEKLAVLYEVAKNDSSIVANSSSQEQCWTMGNGIDLKLLKLTKGDIDRTGVFVVLKYKGKNIYPFENAFLFKNSLHAYRMGAIYNPQSYDNIAKFHNELYQNGENAALEQFNTEAKLFLKGLKWFVNTDQCKDKWIIRGTTLSYNKYEQLRIERIYSILNAIRAIAEFDEIFPCAGSYIKESLKLLSEFQSPQILTLRRERVHSLITESDSAEYYREIEIDKQLESAIHSVDCLIQEHRIYLDKV